jgi:SAM-dependent methyltransferase
MRPGALSRLRCPVCGATEWSASASARVCAGCGHTLADRGGWLDVLGEAPERLSRGQRLFHRPSGAAFYARIRESPLARLWSGRSFAEERALLLRWLEPAPGGWILDLPCGQGNFTQSIAEACTDSTVIGADLSPAQLDLAVRRLRRAGIANVLLLRANALSLPFADATFDAVSACGGLHLYPDVPRALAETFRVLRPGGRVAGLTIRTLPGPFAPLVARAMGVRAFDFDALARDFERAGFARYCWEGGRLLGYFRAERPA